MARPRALAMLEYEPADVSRDAGHQLASRRAGTNAAVRQWGTG